MAMFHESRMLPDEMRAAFEKAAKDNKFLVVIGETIHSEYNIEYSQLTLTVSDANEAAQRLKDHFELGSITVERIFDPRQSFKQGMETDPQDSALGDVVRDFIAYKEQRLAQRRLANLANRPLWKKVLGLN